MEILRHTQNLTVAEHGHGNCYQATLACLLNLPMHKVPDFALWFNKPVLKNYNWFNLTQDWLREYHQVKEASAPLLTQYHRGTRKEFPADFLNIPYMVSGKSPRGNFYHVVIYMNGEMIHDVHPDGTGVIIGTDVDCSYLKPLTEEEINKPEII